MNTLFNATSEQFSTMFSPENLLDGRFENDGDGNPLYIGYTTVPNGDTSLPIWFIQKIEYESVGVVRKRLPDNGVAFSYVWDLRDNYFS